MKLIFAFQELKNWIQSSTDSQAIDVFNGKKVNFNSWSKFRSKFKLILTLGQRV